MAVEVHLRRGYREIGVGELAGWLDSMGVGDDEDLCLDDWLRSRHVDRISSSFRSLAWMLKLRGD